MRVFLLPTLLFITTLPYIQAKPFLSAGEVAIKCNEQLRYTANMGNAWGDTRSQALLNIAFHNAINSIDRQYETFHNVVHTPPSRVSAEAAILGAFNATKSYLITHDYLSNSLIPALTSAQQTALFANLASFVEDITSQLKGSKENIANGFKFGSDVAQLFINAQENDGYNRVVSPVMGVPPFLPDGTTVNPEYDCNKWYSASTIDGFTYPAPAGNIANNGAIYPQWSEVQPIGLPSSSFIPVPPRPEPNSAEMRWNVRQVWLNGNGTNPWGLRTPAETLDAISFASGGAQVITNRIVEGTVANVGNKLTDHDIIYVYAQQALNAHDSFIHNVYWKTVYNYSRPIHMIHWGCNRGASNYPDYDIEIDQAWRFLRNGGQNQEYPCGHCEVTTAATEAIRLALQNLGLTSDDTIPGGPVSSWIGPTAPFTKVVVGQSPRMTFTTFGEIKDRVVKARVTGGMHFPVSGNVGKIVGEQIAQYNVATHMRKL